MESKAAAGARGEAAAETKQATAETNKEAAKEGAARGQRVKFLFSLVFRANYLHWVTPLFLLWLGLMFWGLGGFPATASQWGTIVFSLLVAAFIICITEFADIYSDRIDDRVYRPSNPLVSGDLKIGTARKIFIAENIIGVLLLASLLWVTGNYPLILALIAGWIGGLIYSLPPFRLKGRKIIGPFEFGLCCAIIPLVGWLVVRELDLFIGAFALTLFVGGSGVGITTKLRRTSEAFNSGLISGSNVFNLETIDFGLKVKNAMILEAILVAGAIILIPVFGLLGIFDPILAIFLVSFILPPVLIGLLSDLESPLGISRRPEDPFYLFAPPLKRYALPLLSAQSFILSRKGRTRTVLFNPIN